MKRCYLYDVSDLTSVGGHAFRRFTSVFKLVSLQPIAPTGLMRSLNQPMCWKTIIYDRRALPITSLPPKRGYSDSVYQLQVNYGSVLKYNRGIPPFHCDRQIAVFFINYFSLLIW